MFSYKNNHSPSRPSRSNQAVLPTQQGRRPLLGILQRAQKYRHLLSMGCKSWRRFTSEKVNSLSFYCHLLIFSIDFWYMASSTLFADPRTTYCIGLCRMFVALVMVGLCFIIIMTTSYLMIFLGWFLNPNSEKRRCFQVVRNAAMKLNESLTYHVLVFHCTLTYHILVFCCTACVRIHTTYLYANVRLRRYS